VFYNNDGSSFKKVKDHILQGIVKAQPTWPDLVRRAIENEESYKKNDNTETPGPPL
jgi:hypothetical protein